MFSEIYAPLWPALHKTNRPVAMTSASGLISLVTVAIRHVGGQAYAYASRIHSASDLARTHFGILYYYRRCGLEEKIYEIMTSRAMGL